MLCHLAEVEAEFCLVDTLKHENESLEYQEINPTMTIPMITDGDFKLLGDGISIYKYLGLNPKIKQKFFPEE